MATVRPLQSRIHRKGPLHGGAWPRRPRARAVRRCRCSQTKVAWGRGATAVRCVRAWCQKEAKGGAFGLPEWEERGDVHGRHAGDREEEGAGLTMGSRVLDDGAVTR